MQYACEVSTGCGVSTLLPHGGAPAPRGRACEPPRRRTAAAKLLRPEKVVVVSAAARCPCRAVSGRGGSAGQGSDLGQVAGEDPVPAPDRRPVPAVQAGAVPAVAAFEAADPAFAAGAPFDQLAEAAAVPGGLAGG